MAIGFYWATAALCAFVLLLALDIMGIFSWKNHFQVDGRTVLLTGGSQGMGRGLGKLLAQKGANVVIVARTQKKLDEALKYITAAAKNPQTQRFHSISADVTKPEENIRLIEEVTAWNNGNPPDIVWANAGSSHPGLFIDTPIETMHSQMDINYWAAAYLAQATLRSWLKPSPKSTSTTNDQPRHFIITSSVIAFIGLAGYAPYGPAKIALRGLAENLRSEVNLYNGARRHKGSAQAPSHDVKIHCIFPGTILSPGYEAEQQIKHPVTKVLEEGDAVQNEDQVAAASIKGLENGGFLISTQWLGELMRCGTLGGSARNSVVLDTLTNWVVSLVYLFIGPDMEGKVYKYGKQNGAELPS